MKLKTLWWDFCLLSPKSEKGFTFGQQIPIQTHSPPNQVPFWPFRVMVVPSPGVPYAMGPSLVGGYHPCWPHRGRWRPHGMPSPCCRRMAQWCGGAVAVVVPRTLGPNCFCLRLFWFFDILFIFRSVSFGDWHYVLVYTIIAIWQYCYHLFKLFFDLTERLKLQKTIVLLVAEILLLSSHSDCENLGFWKFWENIWLAATPKFGGDLFPGPWYFPIFLLVAFLPSIFFQEAFLSHVNQPQKLPISTSSS